MRLANKVALVTGGGRGIGKALALELGREGADVALTYHSSARGASEVVDELHALGRCAIAIEANLAWVADARRAVTATVEAFGGVDILVYNAANHNPQPFLQVTEEQYNLTLDVNLKGAFFCVQEAARAMIAHGITGRIITISSVQGFLSRPNNIHYAASKAGMNHFVRTVANELAPYGITINSVEPGAIEVEFYFDRADGYDRDNWGPTIPLGRVGYPRDVAGAVIFLASADADYITGIVIRIDGGIMTRSPHYLPGETTTYPNRRPRKTNQALPGNPPRCGKRG